MASLDQIFCTIEGALKTMNIDVPARKYFSFTYDKHDNYYQVIAYTCEGTYKMSVREKDLSVFQLFLDPSAENLYPAKIQAKDQKEKPQTKSKGKLIPRKRTNSLKKIGKINRLSRYEKKSPSPFF